jgi:hypothetical protein
VFSKVIDDLPGFLEELQGFGVKVIEYHQLDKLEAIQPDLAMFADNPAAPELLSAGEQHSSKTEE